MSGERGETRQRGSNINEKNERHSLIEILGFGAGFPF